MPDIFIQGTSIPAGYLVGRTTPGTGAQELVSIADIGRQIVAMGITAPRGASSSLVLTQPAAGLTITGGPSAFTFALANDLAALEGMAGTGLVARTAAETYAQRTITAGSAKISVANGGGVAANPTVDLGSVAASDLSNGTTGSGAVALASTPLLVTPRLTGYTVATLPAAGTAGRIAYVTDALAPAFLVAVAPGGAIVTPVFDDGTNWVAF